jgi:tRNA(fMet)-specific endonuclease VapC
VKRTVLDTNAYTRLLAGDEKVLDAVGTAETVYMSIFVLGELFAGFADGTKKRSNQDALDKFLRKPTVKTLNATSETAKVFGIVKQELETAGTPLPINDIWIASHTLETGSTLITYDPHFEKIAGLRLWEK